MDKAKLTRTRVARSMFLEAIDMPPSANKTYQCQVNLYERGDGFLAVAAALPGVAGFGPTYDAAIADVVKAFKVALPVHLANGKIPWLMPPVEPEHGGLVRYLTVEVERPAA